MVVFNISDEILKRVKYKDSITPKYKSVVPIEDRNFIGILGEECVKSYLNLLTEDNTYDYDIIFKNKKIDVKSKKCIRIPRLDYECGVSHNSLKQKCDYYLFTRLYFDEKVNKYTKAYFMGFCSKKFFLENAIVCKAGKCMPNGKIPMKADFYYVLAENIDNPKILLEKSFDELSSNLV